MESAKKNNGKLLRIDTFYFRKMCDSKLERKAMWKELITEIFKDNFLSKSNFLVFSS